MTVVVPLLLLLLQSALGSYRYDADVCAEVDSFASAPSLADYQSCGGTMSGTHTKINKFIGCKMVTQHYFIPNPAVSCGWSCQCYIAAPTPTSTYTLSTTATGTTTPTRTPTATLPTPTATFTATRKVCDCRCMDKWEGDNCDVCPTGYDRLGGCKSCDGSSYVPTPTCTLCDIDVHCNGRALRTYPVNGKCHCKCRDMWMPPNCAECPVGFDAAAGCKKCAAGFRSAGGTCEKCTNAKDCNGHATLVTSSDDRQSCVCICSNHWEGTTCDTCPSQYDKTQDCLPCSAEHFNPPVCMKCQSSTACNGRAVSADVHGSKCKCTCQKSWTGEHCEICPDQYRGANCDRCAEKRVNYPDCKACDVASICSNHADDVVADAQGLNCICKCRNKWTGKACDECPPQYNKANDCNGCSENRIRFPACIKCSVDEHCNSRGSATHANSDQSKCMCTCRNQWQDDSCGTCPVRYTGTDCNKCAIAHIRYPECRECSNAHDCSGHAQLVTSDRENERCICVCRNKWEKSDCSHCPQTFDKEKDCGACAEDHILYPICTRCNRDEHCNGRAVEARANVNQTSCTCNCSNYWTGPTCAECPVQYGGPDCNQCAMNYYGKPPDCKPINPDRFELLKGNGSFSSYNKYLYPPPMANLVDRSLKAITFTGSRDPPECRCSVWQCEVLGHPLERGAPLRNEASSKGRDPTTTATLPYTDGCVVVASETVPFQDSCTCPNIAIPPPEDEEKRGRMIMDRLAPEVYAKVSWFRPRRYLLEFRIVKGVDEILSVPHLIVDLPQPRCSKSTQVMVMRSNTTICHDCFDGMSCDGSISTNVTEHYWRESPEVLEPSYCNLQHCMGTESLAASTPLGCTEGSDGTLCGQCVGNNRMGFGGCSSCPSISVSVLLTAVEVLILIGGVLLFIRLSLMARIQKPDSLPQYVKILMSSVQILAQLDYLKIDWGKVIPALFDMSRKAGTVGGIPAPARCLLPSWVSLRETIWVWIALPVVLVIEALVASYLFTRNTQRKLRKCKKKKKKGDDAVEMVRFNGLDGSDPSPSNLLDEVEVTAGTSCSSYSPHNNPSSDEEKDKSSRSVAGSEAGNKRGSVVESAASSDSEVLALQSTINVDWHCTLIECDHCKGWADFQCKKCRRMLCRPCSRPCAKSGHPMLEAGVRGEGEYIPMQKKQVFFTALLILVHISFTLITDQLTKPFVCTTYLDADEGYVTVSTADPRVSCTASNWLWIVSLVFFLLYGLGFPVVFFALLTYEKKHLATQRCVSSYGFLYINYRRPFYYWESVVLIRKVLVVLAIALPTTVYSKIFAATWVLFLALLLNLVFEPYRDARQQRLDSLGVFAGSTSLLAALWVSQMESVDNPLSLPLIVLVTLFNTTSLILTLFVIAMLLRLKWKKLVERLVAWYPAFGFLRRCFELDDGKWEIPDELQQTKDVNDPLLQAEIGPLAKSCSIPSCSLFAAGGSLYSKPPMPSPVLPAPRQRTSKDEIPRPMSLLHLTRQVSTQDDAASPVSAGRNTPVLPSMTTPLLNLGPSRTSAQPSLGPSVNGVSTSTEESSNGTPQWCGSFKTKAPSMESLKHVPSHDNLRAQKSLSSPGRNQLFRNLLEPSAGSPLTVNNTVGNTSFGATDLLPASRASSENLTRL